MVNGLTVVAHWVKPLLSIPVALSSDNFPAFQRQRFINTAVGNCSVRGNPGYATARDEAVVDEASS